MRKHNFAFIDIEATGLNLREHEVIEIGVVITDPELNIIEEFDVKIKPEHIESADPVSLKVSQYNEEDWGSAVSLEEAMKVFAMKVEDCIMVGHNVAFDAGFIEHAFNKTGIQNPMHYHKLDTVSVAWAKMHNDPELERFSLHELCLKFDIKNERAHTALSDARATYELYKKLMDL